jgi:hypothetical protein
LNKKKWKNDDGEKIRQGVRRKKRSAAVSGDMGKEKKTLHERMTNRTRDKKKVSILFLLRNDEMKTRLGKVLKIKMRCKRKRRR